MNNETKSINISSISSIIFILASLVSLFLTLDERENIIKGERILNSKTSLNISFYNIIVILVAVFLSLYAGYLNYKSEEDNTEGKYKASLLLSTNVLSVIGSIIILYVAFLNKQEQSLTVSDVENPLI